MQGIELSKDWSFVRLIPAYDSNKRKLDELSADKSSGLSVRLYHGHVYNFDHSNQILF